MPNSIPKRWHIDESIYDAYTAECLTMVDTHWHSHFLLNLVTEGEGIQEINGVPYPISPGSIILISPVDFHRNIISEGQRVFVDAIKFSDKLYYDSLGQMCSLDDFPIVTRLSPEDYATAITLFDLLIAEQSKKDLLGAEKFASGLIEQLVILALRAAGREKRTHSSSKMHRALVYIHNNFRRQIKITEIAKYVGYSPNYFSSEFKRETGMEFQKYLQHLRLDFAMRLLKLSKLSVTEVCFESGFNTLPHFSQTFKKKFGISPEKVKETQK